MTTQIIAGYDYEEEKYFLVRKKESKGEKSCIQQTLLKSSKTKS